MNEIIRKVISKPGAALKVETIEVVPKPYYTGNWFKSCDFCKHHEPHYCLLYDRVMKNMDCYRCSSWEEK